MTNQTCVFSSFLIWQIPILHTKIHVYICTSLSKYSGALVFNINALLISTCLNKVIISTTNYSVLEVKFVHRQYMYVVARNYYLVGLFRMWGGRGLVVFAVGVSLLFRFRALFKGWNEHPKYISGHWHCNEW